MCRGWKPDYRPQARRSASIHESHHRRPRKTPIINKKVDQRVMRIHGMPLSGASVAILLADKYEDQEFWYPYFRLKENGAQVTAVASKRGQTYASLHQYPARSDTSVRDVNAVDFDAVVIPGGFSPDYMRRDDAMIDFVCDAAESH